MEFNKNLPLIERTFEWYEIDTTMAESYPDDLLLEQVKYARVSTGWGLIAEIIKRYDRQCKLAKRNGSSGKQIR